jgi:hypothetical protein
VRRLTLPSVERLRGNWAPSLIGIGLATLIAGSFWPEAPVTTAMAMIALGTTDVTLARFSGRAALLPTTILHATTYASLYVMFLGATLHSASVSSAAGVGVWTGLDLAASLVVVVIALQRIVRCVRHSNLSRP